MNDNSDDLSPSYLRSDDPRNLPEWLQHTPDDHTAAKDEAASRFWIGLGTLFLVFTAIIGGNALLKIVGYGA